MKFVGGVKWAGEASLRLSSGLKLKLISSKRKQRNICCRKRVCRGFWKQHEASLNTGRGPWHWKEWRGVENFWYHQRDCTKWVLASDGYNKYDIRAANLVMTLKLYATKLEITDHRLKVIWKVIALTSIPKTISNSREGVKGSMTEKILLLLTNQELHQQFGTECTYRRGISSIQKSVPNELINNAVRTKDEIHKSFVKVVFKLSSFEDLNEFSWTNHWEAGGWKCRMGRWFWQFRVFSICAVHLQ